MPVSLRDQCEGAEARLWPKALGLGFVRRAVLCVRQPRLAVCMGKTQHPLDHFPPRCQRRGTYRCSLTDADAPLRSAPSDCSNAECVHTRAAAPVGRHVPLVARATPMRWLCARIACGLSAEGTHRAPAQEWLCFAMQNPFSTIYLRTGRPKLLEDRSAPSQA